MMATMRAIRVHEFGGPENLTLETDELIPKPEANEVLIKVSAAGVNPVEAYIRTGTFAIKPTLPYTPGTDAAGVVEAVGAEVKAFKAGDRVYTCRASTGAYAEYTTAEDVYVAKLEDEFSFSQGAAFGVPYYTAMKAIQIRGQAKQGQTVLVHGASGAVGVASVQLAKALGLRVVGTAGTKDGVDMVKDLGADHVFNHREKGYVEEIKSAVGGVDIIVEMLSDVNLINDIDLLNTGGKILIVGGRGNVEWNPTSTVAKEVTILGVFVWGTTPEQWREMHQTLASVQCKRWANPKISTSYSLAETSQAHKDILSNSGTMGKLVIDMAM